MRFGKSLSHAIHWHHLAELKSKVMVCASFSLLGIFWLFSPFPISTRSMVLLQALIFQNGMKIHLFIGLQVDFSTVVWNTESDWTSKTSSAQLIAIEFIYFTFEWNVFRHSIELQEQCVCVCVFMLFRVVRCNLNKLSLCAVQSFYHDHVLCRTNWPNEEKIVFV